MLAEADESPRLTNSKPVLGPLLQAGPMVRIHPPPAVSQANFDVARAGDGYPQIGRGISTVEILGGRSRCCSSGSRLPSSVSTAVVNLGDDAAGFVFARFFGCARSHASPNFGIALIAPLGPPPAFAVDLVKLPRRRTSHSRCPRPSRNPRRRCGRFTPG